LKKEGQVITPLQKNEINEIVVAKTEIEFELVRF
jgi:hypothetical protein